MEKGGEKEKEKEREREREREKKRKEMEELKERQVRGCLVNEKCESVQEEEKEEDGEAGWGRKDEKRQEVWVKG